MSVETLQQFIKLSHNYNKFNVIVVKAVDLPNCIVVLY